MADLSMQSTIGLLNPAASWAPRPSPRRKTGATATINTFGAVNIAEGSGTGDSRTHQRHEKMWTPVEKEYHSSQRPGEGICPQVPAGSPRNAAGYKTVVLPNTASRTMATDSVYMQSYSPRSAVASGYGGTRTSARDAPVRSDPRSARRQVTDLDSFIPAKELPRHLESRISGL